MYEKAYDNLARPAIMDSGISLQPYIQLKPSNCKNCYRCIRGCPVKSIRIASHQAQIIEEECVLCGRCLVNCPQNAKQIRCDLSKAQSLLESGKKVYASLAPSFAANYKGFTIRSMEKALRSLGFFAVEETAVGATIVKKRYEEMLVGGKQSVIISSCCHSVNLLIQKHYPDALPYLAKVKSPMIAHAEDIKRRDKDAKVIFIGPCISKKAEAESYPGAVDCALTFEELSRWLGNRGVALEAVPDDGLHGRARSFPVAGGILSSMFRPQNMYSYMAVDGMDNCIDAINDIIAGGLDHCFVEMSACTGSCVGGPAMDRTRRSPLRDYATVQRLAGEEDFTVQMPDSACLYKDFPFIRLERQWPGNSAIEEVLHRMGKNSPEQELNCGSCGYNTCRDKAVAVLLGKADLSMCLPYLKERAESFSDTIVNDTPGGVLVLNEQLEVQQINAAACRIFNLQGPSDVLGRPVVGMMDPLPFLSVLNGTEVVRDKLTYLTDYRRTVDLTVLYDKSYHILIGLLDDVTERQAERERREVLNRKAADIADKVIQKQMRAVQDIALLLGETTAETKVALTHLKESIGDV